jgi:4-amino-4-deoxy-L-arabinose transferase-like glycosyltransferase
MPSAALVLCLLALWLLATAGVRPLLLPDEGRYAGVAYEMLRGSGWLPTLHGLPYFHKPPLTYWVDMAGMSLFGVNAFAARLAPALGAWLMGAALYLDLRHRRGEREALLALGVIATTPFFFVGGQYANHDMLVAGLITVAVLCIRRAVDDPARTHGGWRLAGWCACALAVLAKGLIGIVLPALVILPWLLAQRRWREVLRLLHPAGLAAFFLIAAPWFVVMQQRFPGFLDYFFVEQHFRRYAQSGFNNQHPFWFYLAVLPLLTLPWSLWLPAALRRGWRSGRPVDGLLLWWVVAVVGFFSLPASKLVGYVLPALAPLVALLAPALAAGHRWRGVMPAAALGCVAVVAALAWKAPSSNRDIALELGARVQPGDRVVFVAAAFFDVPFYARLREAATVLDDWDDPTIPQRDNWRKELLDAGRFDAAAAARNLWPERRAGELLCGQGTLWLVAERGWQPPAPLQAARRVASGRYADLLSAPRGRGAGCP